MAWEVNASDEGGLCHIAQFHHKHNADTHFQQCLHDYEMASPPYEIEDEDVIVFEDEDGSAD